MASPSTKLKSYKRSSPKDVLRNWKTSFDDLVMATACGLHNLRVSFRHAVETINLLDLI